MAIAYRLSGTFVDVLGTTTGSIGLPAGLANGDTMILVCQSRGTSATVTTPSGYTLPAGGSIQISNSHRLHVFYKYVTNAAGEVAPAVVQSVSGAIRARLSAFSGVNATTQLDVAVQSAKSAAALAVVAPSITPATANTMVVWVFSAGDDVTLNASSQGTNAYSSDGTAGFDGSIALTYELQGSGVAATGTCTMTESINGPDNWCTITLALRPTVAAAANPSRSLGFDSITYAMEMAFGESPFTSEPTWTDVSAYVRADQGITVTRGRNTTFSDIQPGTMSFTLDNRLRLFDPDYSAGTYFGKLVPQVRCRLRVRKSSTNYPIFDGYVQGWPQGYSYPREATVQINCIDLLSRLTSRLLPPALLDMYCIADGAKGHWSLDEDFNAESGIAFDNSGYGVDGQYNVWQTLDSFLPGEPERKCKHFGFSDQNLFRFGASDEAGLALPNMRTVEFWIQVDQFISAAQADATDTTIVFAHGGPGGFIPPPIDPYIIITCQSEVGLFDIEFRQNLIGTVSEFKALVVTLYDASIANVTQIGDDFPIGEPLHVVVVLNEGGTTFGLYLNSVLVSQQTGLSATFEGGSREAGFSLTSIGFVSAQIAHFAVYDSELTSTQIAQHYLAGVTGGKGQYPSDRLEAIADFIGLVDAAQFDDSDLTDVTSLARAGFGGNAITAMQDIVRTEQGRMFVDAAGVLQIQGRTADIKDKTENAVSNTTFSDSGANAYADLVVDAAELELLRNTIYLSTNGGQVVVYDAESRTLYDEQSESLSVLLDDATAARNLGLMRTRQFADPATRLTSLTLLPHGSTDVRYAWCFTVDLGWRITVTRTPQTIGSAISKVCMVEGITHTITQRGPWTTTLYLAPAQNAYAAQPWFVLGDATFGKLGTVAGNQLIY